MAMGACALGAGGGAGWAGWPLLWPVLWPASIPRGRAGGIQRDEGLQKEKGQAIELCP